MRLKSKLHAAQLTFQRISSSCWPVTLAAEEEFLLETSISVSCQGHCVFGRGVLCCIVCINRAHSKSLNAKWLVEEGETYHMDSHRTLECSICGGLGNLNPLSLAKTDHTLV